MGDPVGAGQVGNLRAKLGVPSGPGPAAILPIAAPDAIRPHMLTKWLCYSKNAQADELARALAARTGPDDYRCRSER